MSAARSIVDRARRQSWRVPIRLRRVLTRGLRRAKAAAPRTRPDWGDLHRDRPISDVYGLDRGVPVDRVLIERFLDDHRTLIRGVVLEVHDDGFARRFGEHVDRRDVIDIDPANEAATLVADLTEAGSIPPGSFDCAIVTQTLQFLTDVDVALQNLWAGLRAGGALLITVPVTSRIDPTAGHDGDFWRWTPAGLDVQLRRAFPDASVIVTGLGGLIASVAFLQGLAASDVSPSDLLTDDADFPLIACAVVRR